MDKVIEILVEMRERGILRDYAIGGATATLFYTEPFATQDVDVFFSVVTKGIISLAPFYDFLVGEKGFAIDKEYIIVGTKPVQFLPATDELEREALEHAIEKNYDYYPEGDLRTPRRVHVRIFTPEYLIAIALKVGRDKDHFKILKLLKQAQIDGVRLMDICRRHGLMDKVRKFRETYYA